MGEKVCIHANPSLAHQKHWANGLKGAFVHHGFECDITYNPKEKGADIHVVLGPHYAKKYHLNHETILLDRCYYRGDPDHISLGWMLPCGGRRFTEGEGREPPQVKKRQPGDRTIFLADYQGDIGGADTVRRHPAESKPTESLLSALNRHDIAIGYKTTALVDAALLGLSVVSYDTSHILNQPNWLRLLPYADWAYNELNEAIDHLCLSR